MKFIWKFLLLLVASAFFGALTAPWVNSLFLKMPSLNFPFEKILNRSVLGWLIVFLIVFRKQLFTLSAAQLGLARSPGWKRDLGYGLFFATLSFVLLNIVFYVVDARILYFQLFTPKYIQKIFEYALAALFIGFFEEVFFRGFVFQGFLQVQKRWLAVVSSSLFYALTHFLKPKDFHVDGEVTLLFSFQSLLRFLDPLSTPERITPYFFGLFLFGVVLAYARLKTGRLYFSMALHGMWVYLIKIDSGIIRPTHLGGEHWFFGDGKIINGITGWIFLLSCLLWIHFFVPLPFKRHSEVARSELLRPAGSG